MQVEGSAFSGKGGIEAEEPRFAPKEDVDMLQHTCIRQGERFTESCATALLILQLDVGIGSSDIHAMGGGTMCLPQHNDEGDRDSKGI